MTKRRFPALAALVATIGASTAFGAVVSSAGATPPSMFRFPVETHEAMLEPESSVCGFPIRLDESGEISVHVHVDAQGNHIRTDVWGHFMGVLSANGIQLRTLSNDHKFFDVRTQTMAELGVVSRVSAPGLGVVLMDRGRLIWNIDADGETVGAPTFEAGPHPVLHGDFQGLCEALTP